MPEMIGIPDIAKRLGVDGGTVRRFIARENETLKLALVRGKGEKLLLSRGDADRLIASYEARRGPVSEVEQGSPTDDRFGFFYVYSTCAGGTSQPRQNRLCRQRGEAIERTQDRGANREAAESLALQEILGLRRNGKHHP